jgi:hypothetical protein
MGSGLPEYQPVEGKTYSLFGNHASTGPYYHTIRSLADKILTDYDIATVLETLGRYSSKKRMLKNIVSTGRDDSLIAYCVHTIHETLKPFTEKTQEHLSTLSLVKYRDRRLATSEEQYHLYMLEIELTNRINRNAFLISDRKISLQPYCLQDFSVDCKATKDGFDTRCRMCSGKCYQHLASRILKEHHVDSYIWMGASIKREARKTRATHQSFGILGIACIPELVWGMRKCRKYQIPAVGIPLNANRCIRWFGEFHQNSVDLTALRELVQP